MPQIRMRDCRPGRLLGAAALVLAAVGAFYLWADVDHPTNDSVAFCARMLAEANVAASPGVDFDRERGGRFLRLSYCGPEADTTEAAAWLRAWLV